MGGCAIEAAVSPCRGPRSLVPNPLNLSNLEGKTAQYSESILATDRRECCSSKGAGLHQSATLNRSSAQKRRAIGPLLFHGRDTHRLRQPGKLSTSAIVAFPTLGLEYNYTTAASGSDVHYTRNRRWFSRQERLGTCDSYDNPSQS